MHVLSNLLVPASLGNPTQNPSPFPAQRSGASASRGGAAAKGTATATGASRLSAAARTASMSLARAVGADVGVDPSGGAAGGEGAAGPRSVGEVLAAHGGAPKVWYHPATLLALARAGKADLACRRVSPFLLPLAFSCFLSLCIRVLIWARQGRPRLLASGKCLPSS